MKHIYIIGVAMLLLTASCGRQQQAKTVVKIFMESYVTDYSKVSFLDFSSVDSTRAISDSVIDVLRQHAPTAHFQHVSQYQERKGRVLMHIRAKYLYDTDTCSATFYLTPDMNGVVAFKEN